MTTTISRPGRKRRECCEPGPILLCMGLFWRFCVRPCDSTPTHHAKDTLAHWGRRCSNDLGHDLCDRFGDHGHSYALWLCITLGPAAVREPSWANAGGKFVGSLSRVEGTTSTDRRGSWKMPAVRPIGTTSTPRRRERGQLFQQSPAPSLELIAQVGATNARRSSTSAAALRAVDHLVEQGLRCQRARSVGAH